MQILGSSGLKSSLLASSFSSDVSHVHPQYETTLAWLACSFMHERTHGSGCLRSADHYYYFSELAAIREAELAKHFSEDDDQTDSDNASSKNLCWFMLNYPLLSGNLWCLWPCSGTPNNCCIRVNLSQAGGRVGGHSQEWKMRDSRTKGVSGQSQRSESKLKSQRSEVRAESAAHF